MKVTVEQIKKYLSDLSDELKQKDIKGEILIVGGAAMMLSFNARVSTKDIDAVFKPEKEMRDSVIDVGFKNNLEPGWLNDAVKVYISTEEFKRDLVLKFENLDVYVPEPHYLLAMKVLSMRQEKSSTDIDDVKTLIKNLEIDSSEEVFNIVKRYYPNDEIPAKSKVILDEIISKVFNNDFGIEL